MKAIDLLKVFLVDAAEIIGAREKAIIIHGSGDIPAAGREVEGAVRGRLGERLPASYHLGHGHIVDQTLRTSPQLDIVIADRLGTPTLMKASDGTEYFPYESVLAVGEIKSTYYHSKDPIGEFCSALTKVQELEREKTPDSYIGHGIELGAGLSLSSSLGYKNPLFSFQIFVNAGDFDPDKVKDIFSSREISELPSAVCFLDKGLIFYATYSQKPGESTELGQIQVPAILGETQSGDRGWVFLSFDGQDGPGHNWGLLYLIILQALTPIVLKSPNLMNYAGTMFRFSDGKVLTRD